MVVTLNRLLVCHTGFLEQVCLNIGTSDLALGSEVDTDEFTLGKSDSCFEIRTFQYNQCEYNIQQLF
jgi:hypothetical protein